MRWPKWGRGSEGCDGDHYGFAPCREGVAEGPDEEGRVDLEAVAGLGLDPVGAAQDGRAQEVAVDVAGAAEQVVLEQVVLHVGQGVGHVRLAGQERGLPEHGAVAAHADLTFN